MKTIFKSRLSQASFFLMIAAICAFIASCEKKDNCQNCEQKAEEISEANSSSPDVISKESKGSMPSSATTNESSSNKAWQKNNNIKAEKPSKTQSDDSSNISIINPNKKSNSDSKRTYGSSGTGGGSGTSGSGGDGNGSSGWNDGVKKNN